MHTRGIIARVIRILYVNNIRMSALKIIGVIGNNIHVIRQVPALIVHGCKPTRTISLIIWRKNHGYFIIRILYIRFPHRLHCDPGRSTIWNKHNLFFVRYRILYTAFKCIYDCVKLLPPARNRSAQISIVIHQGADLIQCLTVFFQNPNRLTPLGIKLLQHCPDIDSALLTCLKQII